LAVALKLQNRTKSTGASVKYQYFCRIVLNEAEVVKQFFASLMEVLLAGLRFVIGGHLHMHIPSGVGSCYHLFSLCIVGLDFDLK
jgi:hypothetical protein